jgi:hypothetical protein
LNCSTGISATWKHLATISLQPTRENFEAQKTHTKKVQFSQISIGTQLAPPKKELKQVTKNLTALVAGVTSEILSYMFYFSDKHYVNIPD